MATDRQIAANRANAALSTGPRTKAGKRHSSRNAVQHGLTAETVVTTLEDRADYEAFESAVRADFAPQTAIEQQLVARLASLLWRLRRATLIETGLFEIQGRILHQRRRSQAKTDLRDGRLGAIYRILQQPQAPIPNEPINAEVPEQEAATVKSDVASVYLRLCHINSRVMERLGRYETALWRQVAQLLLMLDAGRRRGRAELCPSSHDDS